MGRITAVLNAAWSANSRRSCRRARDLLVLVLLGVAVVVVEPARGATNAPRRSAPYPRAVRALIAHLGVFHRRQTSADKAGNRFLGGDAIAGLTRLVATLPRDHRIFLFISHAFGGWAISQEGLDAPGVVSSGPTCCTYPNVSFTTHGRSTLEALVRDRVARVRWSWVRDGPRPRLTVNIAIHNNFAVATVPAAYGDISAAGPTTATAYASDGRVISSSNG